jgi:hypothetical protein
LEKTAVFSFFDPSSVFVELRLYDLVEAAIDGGKAFMHLFAKAADLNMHLADFMVHSGAEGTDRVRRYGCSRLLL